MTGPADVPSPIDLQDEADARAWAAQAQAARPWRADVFAAISARIASVGRPVTRVLELGSGPGFLAEVLLRDHPGVQLTLLDFSEPMHALARERLAPWLDRVTFVTRSFKDAGWAEGLGPFDHVVTNQAVHELRHHRHATPLHAAVRGLLSPGGSYLVSDHYLGEDGMGPAKADLYLTIDGQRDALLAGGFEHVERLLRLKGLVLHRAQ